MNINVVEIDPYGQVTLKLDFPWCQRLSKACLAAYFTLYGSEVNKDIFDLSDGRVDDNDLGDLYDAAAGLLDLAAFTGNLISNAPREFSGDPSNTIANWRVGLMGLGPKVADIEDQRTRNAARKVIRNLASFGSTEELVQRAKDLRAAHDLDNPPREWDRRHRPALPGEPEAASGSDSHNDVLKFITAFQQLDPSQRTAMLHLMLEQAAEDERDQAALAATIRHDLTARASTQREARLSEAAEAPADVAAPAADVPAGVEA